MPFSISIPFSPNDHSSSTFFYYTFLIINQLVVVLLCLCCECRHVNVSILLISLSTIITGNTTSLGLCYTTKFYFGRFLIVYSKDFLV